MHHTFASIGLAVLCSLSLANAADQFHPRPGFPHGPGHRYSEPPCSTTLSSPISSPTCSSTLCADYINSCGIWYGGCYAACPGLPTPTFTDPGCPTPPPTATTLTTGTTETSFCDMKCWDAVDPCGQWYGGCASYCGEPYSSVVTSTPSCSITPTPVPTTSLSSCLPVCAETVDACGNTYGPGCWTSCVGDPWRMYTGTVPSCSLN